MELNGIKDLIRKRFSEQHRGKNIIGSIIISEIKNYFNIETPQTLEEDEIIGGYIRNYKLFLKTNDQALKINIYKQKTTLLNKINEKLLNLGYNIQISEIILK